ncbi:hypothetical protein DHW03_01645 [Pedobacter yonginense]|uniref:Uncharacterized protein n=1 Tax=Pedobacter yonginense TaxID=651869 RepID=A0A317EQ46_9SPHI|nr:hypothetical protein [Pedobacter yonginense]PWS28582.1 hypothetical protein DHW03_01645 [Pedobacter yonginense]
MILLCKKIGKTDQLNGFVHLAYLPIGTDLNGGCVLFFYEDNRIINVALHLFPALFFITLAANSYFLFTRSDAIKITAEKNKRNRIYRICGILMIIFAALIRLSALPFAKIALLGTN